MTWLRPTSHLFIPSPPWQDNKHLRPELHIDQYQSHSTSQGSSVTATRDRRRKNHGVRDGIDGGEAHPPRGRLLRLPPQGLVAPRPHPRRGGAVRGVHPGAAHRPRGHLRPAHGQPGPGDRRRRRLPAGRGGAPRQGPRRRLLPLRLARVQLLRHGLPEERAGLGVQGQQLLGGQGGGDRLRGGRLRRGQGVAPPPPDRGVPRPPLHQQAGAPHQGVRGAAQVRRGGQPHRRRDQGAAQEGAPLTPGLRAQAQTQGRVTDSRSMMLGTVYRSNLHFPSV